MQAQKNKVSVLKQIKKKKHCYLFLAPFFTLFLLFTVIPVLMAMGLSFTSFNIFETPKFVGIKNYVQLFFYDDLFIKSFSNTLTIAIFVGPLGYLLSLVVAWSINELAPVLRTVLVVLFYAPSISGNAYMIWTLMFNGDAYGLLNAWGKKLGFMGNELASLQEWNENKPLDWDLLRDRRHADFLRFVSELNSLYMKKKALWSNEQGHDNFQWLNCGSTNPCVFGISRPLGKDTLLAFFNFSDKAAIIEPDIYGDVTMLINSDWDVYGGNTKKIARRRIMKRMPAYSGVIYICR